VRRRASSLRVSGFPMMADIAAGDPVPLVSASMPRQDIFTGPQWL
jgi:hypothetical protein